MQYVNGFASAKLSKNILIYIALHFISLTLVHLNQILQSQCELPPIIILGDFNAHPVIKRQMVESDGQKKLMSEEMVRQRIGEGTSVGGRVPPVPNHLSLGSHQPLRLHCEYFYLIFYHNIIEFCQNFRQDPYIICHNETPKIYTSQAGYYR